MCVINVQTDTPNLIRSTYIIIIIITSFKHNGMSVRGTVCSFIFLKNLYTISALTRTGIMLTLLGHLYIFFIMFWAPKRFTFLLEVLTNCSSL